MYLFILLYFLGSFTLFIIHIIFILYWSVIEGIQICLFRHKGFLKDCPDGLLTEQVKKSRIKITKILYNIDRIT